MKVRGGLTVGSLFSGIGGLDLGLERAGMSVIWQSEIDPYACQVLKKHWPEVVNHGDIRQLDGRKIERPDLICGGFPCQDLSQAGKRAGLRGSRSGLFYEMARVIAETGPRYALFENVPGAVPYLGQIAEELRRIGYTPLRPVFVSASSVGAPHERERIFILAHPDERRQRTTQRDIHERQPDVVGGSSWWAADPADRGNGPVKSHVGRVAYGVPSRVDRLRCLGNAVVPQVAEYVGRLVLEFDAEMRA